MCVCNTLKRHLVVISLSLAVFITFYNLYCNYIKFVFIFCNFFNVLSSYFSDVFKNAMKLGTFPAILVTYTASALLHVSIMMMMMIMIFT